MLKQVEDQSRLGDIVHDQFKGKFRSDDAVNPETTRRIWRHKVRTVNQNWHSPGELSFEEFPEAMLPLDGTMCRARSCSSFPEATKVLLCNAVLERLTRREDTHVKDWGRVRCLFGSKERRHLLR